MGVDGGRVRVRDGPRTLGRAARGGCVVAFSSSADAGAYSLVLREILDPYYRGQQRGR